ncbi:sensor histidine kinase TodS [Peptococcaceae bacterium CEB3]|nr:sensor histidine kinase TodS [Peptococcaceae bacterium CEB3]
MARIAIVEDFPAIRELYKYALEPMQAVIQDYPTGSEAIKQLPDFGPDLLILDHRLPDMTGNAIIEHLPQIQSIPIIVISGYLDPEILPRYESLGVSKILAKPIDLALLLEQVSQLLNSAAPS